MTARAWNRRLSHAEMRAAQCVCVCVRCGWGGTLLVTWFIIRSCKVVRLEGIRDDKLDLTVGEEGGGAGLTHSWSKGGGVRKKILTARLTVLGPSVPFAVLWRKRCTKALLTPLFAPSLLRLPHTASFSSSFTGRFGCFFICKQLRAWCWADGRGFFFFFLYFGQNNPWGLWAVSQSGQTLRVGAGRAEWSTAAGPFWEWNHRQTHVSIFLCAGMTDGRTCWLLIIHVLRKDMTEMTDKAGMSQVSLFESPSQTHCDCHHCSFSDFRPRVIDYQTCSFSKPTNQTPIFSFQVKFDAFWTGQMFHMCFLLQAFTSYKFLKVKDFNISLYLLLTRLW